MKIRSGFVSNSSSSSFVVAFPSMPQSQEELKEMMFPSCGMDESIEPVHDWQGSYTVRRVVEQVFNDIKDGLDLVNKAEDDDFWLEYFEAEYEEINKKLEIEYPELCAECEAYYRDRDSTSKHLDGYLKLREIKDRIWKEESSKIMNAFFDANKGKVFIPFEFSDESGCFQSFLEHGNIFRNLSHYVMSRH